VVGFPLPNKGRRSQRDRMLEEESVAAQKGGAVVLKKKEGQSELSEKEMIE